MQVFKRTYDDDIFFDVADQLSWCDLCNEYPVCLIFHDTKTRNAFEELKLAPMIPFTKHKNILLVVISPFGYNLDAMIEKIRDFNPKRIYIGDAGSFTSTTFSRIKLAFDERLYVYGRAPTGDLDF